MLKHPVFQLGGVAQLVERSNSMQEVPSSKSKKYFRIFLSFTFISDDLV
jgi:hypothetical protein